MGEGGRAVTPPRFHRTSIKQQLDKSVQVLARRAGRKPRPERGLSEESDGTNYRSGQVREPWSVTGETSWWSKARQWRQLRDDKNNKNRSVVQRNSTSRSLMEAQKANTMRRFQTSLAQSSLICFQVKLVNVYRNTRRRCLVIDTEAATISRSNPYKNTLQMDGIVSAVQQSNRGVAMVDSGRKVSQSPVRRKTMIGYETDFDLRKSIKVTRNIRIILSDRNPRKLRVYTHDRVRPLEIIFQSATAREQFSTIVNEIVSSLPMIEESGSSSFASDLAATEEGFSLLPRRTDGTKGSKSKHGASYYNTNLVDEGKDGNGDRDGDGDGEEGEEEEEEEEEESDSEEDDDEEEVGRKRQRSKSSKKSKRVKNSFFDDEADVDDDDEDESEGEFAGSQNQVEVSAQDKANEERLRRRLENKQKFLQTSEGDIVTRLEDRYKRDNQGYGDLRRGDDEEIVNQNANLPTVNDPKLWCIKCKPGDERMLSLQLMNKYRNLLAQGVTPKVFSILHSGSKGFIYVEARTQQYASDFVMGIRGIFRSKITLVPIKQMPSVLSTRTQKKVVKVGDYVRLRRFPYKGDLGRVVRVNELESRVVVKYVPRLDFSTFNMDLDEANEHRLKKVIPPKRFFNHAEAEAAGARIERDTVAFSDQALDKIGKDFFSPDGYIIKEFRENFVQTKDVKPTLEELQAFRLGGQSVDDPDALDEGRLEDGNVLEELASAALSGDAAKAPPVVFKRGDIVIVKEGQLHRLKGKVVAVDMDGLVEVDPLDENLRITDLKFPPSYLMKLFEPGDHVKVLNGAHAGETGSVVKVIEDSEKWKAIVFTDSTSKEIIAFIDDLQISAEVAQARDSLKGFQLQDLVDLGTQVGVVVRISSETMEVLLQTGNIRTVTPQEIRRKLNNMSRNTSAMDKLRQPISKNTIVKVVAGENTGIEGTIIHISRSFVFIHSRMRMANGGVFVERARSVQQAGQKLRNAGGFGVNQASRGQSATAGGGRGRGRGGAGREDTLLGKTVRIRGGRYKGYIGIVVSATDENVKVELHAEKRMVDMAREKVIVAGDKQGAVKNVYSHPNQFGNDSYDSFGVSQGQFANSAPGTPSHTPGDLRGSGNSAWNPEAGSTTPAPTTPGADDSFQPTESEANYQPPPTPAAFAASGSSFASVNTPAPNVPQTPATPGVPATPAAGAGDYDAGGDASEALRDEDLVRITEGKNAGQTARYVGRDGQDAIVRIGANVVIVPLHAITRSV